MTDHIADWTALVGQRICIRKKGRDVRTGEVEAVSEGGDTLWLRIEGVEPRALYQKRDGYTAWTIPDTPVADPPIDHFLLEPAEETLHVTRIVYT